MSDASEMVSFLFFPNNTSLYSHVKTLLSRNSASRIHFFPFCLTFQEQVNYTFFTKSGKTYYGKKGFFLGDFTLKIVGEMTQEVQANMCSPVGQ